MPAVGKGVGENGARAGAVAKAGREQERGRMRCGTARRLPSRARAKETITRCLTRVCGGGGVRRWAFCASTPPPGVCGARGGGFFPPKIPPGRPPPRLPPAAPTPPTLMLSGCPPP